MTILKLLFRAKGRNNGFTPNILLDEEQQSLRPVDHRNIGKIPGKVLNSEEVREEIRI
jgi:hypothetical protein